jgi:predicted lipoprotein
MTNRGWIRVTLAVVVVALIALFCRVTVVADTAPSGTVDSEGNFVAAPVLSVPEAYAEDNWESKILPAIDAHAIDPAVFAEGMKTDLAALGEKYAARANETSPWSFCLKGKVKVIGVENADSKTKTRLLVDVPPYDGVQDMKIQTSTVIRTNAIRDAVGFLKLDDFANQVEFAELTKVFNARVQRDVLQNLDAQALMGEEIELTGCVSVGKQDEEAFVVPIRIVAGE